jgi:hypothetical protein
MKKAAAAIRHLGSENDTLKDQIEDLKKTASSLSEIEKVANTSKIVLQLVADGEVDPEDALEKFSEVSSLSAEEIKLVLRKSGTESIGNVKTASVDSESDPLTAYLLGI